MIFIGAPQRTQRRGSISRMRLIKRAHDARDALFRAVFSAGRLSVSPAFLERARNPRARWE